MIETVVQVSNNQSRSYPGRCRMRRIAVFVAITACMFQVVCSVAASAKTVATFKEAQGREGPGAYYKLVVLIPDRKSVV